MAEMVQITDYDIQALTDEELDWETRKKVMDTINADPQSLKRYNHLKKQKSLLKNWWASQKKH